MTAVAGVLVSVNVGLPRQVPWRGSTVLTAAWKDPVAGRRHVGRLNLDGDGQGDRVGHGGEHRALLAYQVQSYRFWEEHLGRGPLPPGLLGENLTLDGLPDDQVRIGDRYRVGTAVLEVSQPRVTCYRAGLRIGEPRMAALLVAHHRPGFYLRVVTEGEVGAGDAVELVAAGPEPFTVADASALLYLPGRERAGLERALRVPALSPGWRGSFQDLLWAADEAADGDVGPGPATTTSPAWAGFRPLRLVSVVPETEDVTSLVLAAADGGPLPVPLPGQSVALRVRAPTAAAPVVRSYSLSGPPAAPTWRVSVKREPGGAVSGWLRAGPRAGDVVDVAAPRGTAVLDPGEGPLLLLSAGIGVTPVLAMLHSLAAGRSQRRVWWVHAARDVRHHAFAAEAVGLLAELPHARAHVVHSRPGPTDPPPGAAASTGHLTLALLRDLGVPPQARVHLCGPSGFVAAARAVLEALGVPPDAVSAEDFGALGAARPGVVGTGPASRPHPPDGPPGTGPVTTFARSGVSASWDARFTSLLELAEACDVPVRWSCRTGVCRTCVSGVLDGEVTHDPEPLEPSDPGTALICCARPRGDLVLDL